MKIATLNTVADVASIASGTVAIVMTIAQELFRIVLPFSQRMPTLLFQCSATCLLLERFTKLAPSESNVSPGNLWLGARKWLWQPLVLGELGRLAYLGLLLWVGAGIAFFTDFSYRWINPASLLLLGSVCMSIGTSVPLFLTALKWTHHELVEIGALPGTSRAVCFCAWVLDAGYEVYDSGLVGKTYSLIHAL